MTAPWLTNTEMVPAMKKAGSRHRMTCSCAYHWARSRVASMAVRKRGVGDRHEEDEGEDGDDPAQCFQFFAGIHDGGGVRVEQFFDFGRGGNVSLEPYDGRR